MIALRRIQKVSSPLAVLMRFSAMGATNIQTLHSASSESGNHDTGIHANYNGAKPCPDNSRTGPLDGRRYQAPKCKL